MDAERWHRIEDLLHAAIHLSPTRRKAFLVKASQGDEQLRIDVEALLEQHASTTRLRGGSLRTLAKDLTARACPSTLIPGTRLGPYRIEIILGVGGMGEVYRAFDTRLNRTVAVKIIRGHSSVDNRIRERFYREARAASALNHRHICAVFDIGECNGQPYLVMEYLEGSTLRALLDRGSMTIQDALLLAIQIADALHAAHSHGILHRDIKSANVLVTEQQEVKVLDFGIAKSLDPGIEEGSLGFTLLTDTGDAVGTISYMSPEQARGEKLDARSDLFSFGVLLYQMVTGQLPFAGSTAAIVYDAILNHDPPSVRSLRPEVPRELESVINSALEKKRETRIRSAADLKSALSHLKVSLESRSPSPVSTRARIRSSFEIGRQKLLLLIFLALLIAVGVLFSWKLTSSPSPVHSVAVLSLETFPPVASQSYIAGGITDGLIFELSKIRALKVVRATRKPLAELARKLNTDRLIDGSVTNAGREIRLTVRVIELRENRTLWERQYERDRVDLSTLQGTVARDLVRIMNIPVTAQEMTQLSSSEPVRVEAYEAYLRGRQLWNRQTAKDLKSALEEFRDSIDAAPNYAPSYAGLADCYSMLGWFGVVKPLDILDAARAAARKATQLDPKLAEAHISLGLVTGFADWDWPAAEREFKTALSLNPSLADCHHWYAHMLEATGRPEEGLVELKRAHELDALYPLIEEDIANAYLNNRDYDQAYAEVTRLTALQPNFWRVHYLLGIFYKERGMFAEAIPAMERAVELSGGNVITSAAVGQLYALSGRDGDARRILKKLIDRSRQSYVDPEPVAEVYAALGQEDLALDYLEAAYSNHSLRLSWIIKREMGLDSLRAQPRFKRLLKKMGLG